MALRYALSDSTVVPADDGDLVRLPAMRSPVDLEYRSHEDVNGLNAILSASHCRILGRTAVGKSSVLPKLLARQSGNTVVIVTAHPLLSCAGYEFFESNPDHVVRGTGLTSTLLRDTATELTDYNLVWSSAANLVSWLLSRRATMKKGGRPLENIIVFLDEAHECDAYTHVVRTMSLQLGAKSLLLVSATFEPAGHRVNQDKVRIHRYSPELTPDKWDIHDSAAPWFHGNIKDTALVFIDSNSVARGLCKDLASIGYVHHRLTARSTYKEYIAAVTDLYDTTLPPVVLVLDRSYRSGFNFDVSLIIDSGLLYYVDGEIGYCRYGSRAMYNVEYVQSAGRGGRFRRVTDYYCPNIDFETKICDLEPVEMEGAALVTRLLGYLPVRETANTVMTYDNLPAQHPVLATLNGCMPLTYYCRDKFGARKDGVRPVKIPEVQIRPISVTSTRRARSVTPKPVTVESVCESTVVSTKASMIRGSAAVNSVCSRRDSACYVDAPSFTAKSDCEQMSTISKRMFERGTVIAGEGLEGTVCDVKPSDSVSNLGITDASRGPARRASVSSNSTIEVPRPVSRASVKDGRTLCSFVTGTNVTAVDDIWNRLASALGVVENEAPRPGSYIKVPDIEPDKLIKTSRHFPKGAQTVVELSSDKALARLWENLPSHHRKFGLYSAVTRYNVLNMELRSLKDAINTVFSKSFAVLSNKSVKERITRVLMKASVWEMERAALYKAIGFMAGDKYTIAELTGVRASEDARTLLYERKMRSIRDKSAVDNTSVDDWLGCENVLGPLLLTDRHKRNHSITRSGREREAVRTVYVKPCLGVSKMVEHPGGEMDIIPSRLVRRMSGCSKVTVTDVKING